MRTCLQFFFLWKKKYQKKQRTSAENNGTQAHSRWEVQDILIFEAASKWKLGCLLVKWLRAWTNHWIDSWICWSELHDIPPVALPAFLSVSPQCYHLNSKNAPKKSDKKVNEKASDKVQIAICHPTQTCSVKTMLLCHILFISVNPATAGNQPLCLCVCTYCNTCCHGFFVWQVHNYQ